MDVNSLTSGFDLGGITGGLLTGGYWLFLAVIVIGMIGGVAFVVWNRKQYKYHVKLKIYQNKQFLYYEDVAKKVMVNGAPMWYIKGLKETVSIPPGESMYTTAGGGWVAEGFYERNAGVLWGKDAVSRDTFENTLKALEAAGTERNQGSVDKHFQPMTSTDRALQANEVTKAVLRRGKDLWTMLWQLAPAVILLCVLALVLIFWGNIAKPVQELQNTNAEISKQNLQVQQQNFRFYQMLTGGRGNGTYIVQQIAGDESIFNASALVVPS